MVTQAAIPEQLQRGRLRRRTEHRVIAGVAGGLADRLGASVAFVRFLIVLAAWAPWTLAVYAGAALFLPANGRDRPDWDNLVGAARLGLVLAVPWLALPEIYIGEPLGGSLGWWIVSYGLVGVGAAVLMSADYLRGRGRSAEEARLAVLAALPVGACAVGLAVGIVLAEDVRWERLVPLAAVVGGAALLAASRREFVAPAMVALGAAVVIVASGARLEGGVGDMKLTASDVQDGRIVGRRAVGDVEVDLRGLRGARCRSSHRPGSATST